MRYRFALSCAEEGKVEMRQMKMKFIRDLTMLSSASLVVVAVIFYLFFPELAWQRLISVPVFFYLAGLLYIFILSFCRERFPASMQVNCFLACKTVKFLLSALFVAVYAMTVRKDVVAFLLTFIVLFVVYLVFETRFFLRQEAGFKQNIG